MKPWLITLIFFSANALADGDDYGYGSYWSQKCNAQGSEYTRCVDYVSGIFDAYRTLAENDLAKPFICVPKNILYPQLADTYAKFLRENPQLQQKPAGVLAIQAISRAFPCK